MQKENVVKVIIGRVKPDVKISCHAELVSASSTHVVSQRQQQRQAWKTLNQVQGDNPCLIMTHHGFTLIELLVVVLIIGILAAVALPQYQKAVEKSKATQAITMLKSVGSAMQAHHLASGTWATSFDELALDIPWTGNNKFVEASGYSQGISNQDWSLQFRKTKHNGNNIVSLVVGRISGAYAGAGFIIYFDEEYNLPEDEILCIEFKNSSPITPFAKEKGSYCEKIMKGKRKYGEHELYYTLP